MDVRAAADRLREAFPEVPRVAVILGSGLGHLADGLESPTVVPFAEVPGLPAAGVKGHTGRFVAGRLEGHPVLLQAGRYHAYEGHPMEVVVAPVRVLAALGVEVLIVTNAAGGADPRIEPGELLLLDDHINFMGRSALAGPVHGCEPRFPDMSAPYDPGLQQVALDVARGLRIPLRRGVYAAALGPAYETAAEVRMLRRLGADVIGMSTVPEVTVARANGLRCMGFSMVTNKGTGIASDPLGHEEVMMVGRRAGQALARVLGGVLAAIAGGQPTGAK